QGGGHRPPLPPDQPGRRGDSERELSREGANDARSLALASFASPRRAPDVRRRGPRRRPPARPARPAQGGGAGSPDSRSGPDGAGRDGDIAGLWRGDAADHGRLRWREAPDRLRVALALYRLDSRQRRRTAREEAKPRETPWGCRRTRPRRARLLV